MADDRGEIRSIAWLEVFPGLRLFSALRMAMSFKALVLGAVALVLTAAGWQVCGKIFSNTDDAELKHRIYVIDGWPWDDATAVPALSELDSIDTLREKSPFVLAWNHIADPFLALFETSITAVHFVYLLTCSLWALLVWSFFGGALTRLAAVKFAHGENPSLGQVLSFSRRKIGSYFAAPLFPLLGVFLLAGGLALIGLLMRSDVGLLVAGGLWGGALFVGFLMAFLLLGLFFSWPLMWGAISVEGTDSFGALSHSYSYAYQRPLHYLLYATAAAVIGFIGWYLITLFAIYIVSLSNWGISWGTGTARYQEIVGGTGVNVWGERGLAAMSFWNGCVLMLAVAFVYSYFWSASTVIYFLLRRLVDATEIDEVFTPEEHALHGLPSLKTGPDGVAQLAEDAEIDEKPAEHTA